MINIKQICQLIVFFMCCVQCISAQSGNDNYLYVENVWAVVTDNQEQTGADTEITYCYTWGDPDSVVNGHSYRTVYLTHDNPVDFFDLKYDVSYPTLCYREEGKKIFRYDNGLGKDVLLYDFGLHAGDETTILDGMRVRVTEEFSAGDLKNYCYAPYKNNPNPKAWRVCGVDNEAYEDIWIDGAGSLYTGLLLRSDFPDDVSLTTVFNSSYSFSRYTPYDKIQPVLLREIWYEPDYKDYEDSELYINAEFVADTLIISGYSSFYCYTHLFRCHVSGDEITISAIPVNPICNIMDGYLYSKYEIKFPGFAAGTYTIKKENKRLWSGKLQDTILTCNGPATDIDETHIPPTTNHQEPLYDLSGRKLTHTPDRGFYIQNGKKFIK